METKEETTSPASAISAWKQFTELKPEQPCSRKWKGTFQVELLKGVAGDNQRFWDFANVLKSHFARSPDMSNHGHA